jgi:hypothetical protein
LTLGFAGGTSTPLFNSSPGAADMLLARINKPGANTGQLTLQSRVAGTATTNATGSLGSFALTNGNWNNLSLTLTRTGTPDQFTLNTSLFNAFSDGTLGTLIDSIGSTTISSSSLYGDSSLFAGFRGFAPNGLDRLDNFALTQVPEPSTYGLLLVGGLALWVLRRGRRRG